MGDFYSYQQAAAALGVSRSDVSNAVFREGALGVRSRQCRMPLARVEIMLLASHFFLKRIKAEHAAYVDRVMESLDRETIPPIGRM